MIKLNVSKIIDNSINRKEFTDEVDQLDRISLAGKLSVFAKIDKVPCGVIADIKIKGREKVTCDRCLGDFEKDINKEFNQEFVTPTQKLSKEENDDKEEGFVIDEKGDIDLEKVIIEEILLDDNRNICNEKCKGICQNCGKDLNKEECCCKIDREK